MSQTQPDLFESAVAYVLKWEGGYVNNPADPGGETRFGISKRNYPSIDISSLTADQAKSLYKSDFWDHFQLSAITNPPLAIKVLDVLVNMGTSGAKVIQQALCAVGHPVAVDGLFGVGTIAAINQSNYVSLLSEIRAQMAAHYASLALNNPSEKTFLLGWMRRASGD